MSPKSPSVKLNLDESNNVKDVEEIFFGGMVDKAKMRGTTPDTDLNRTKMLSNRVPTSTRQSNKIIPYEEVKA